MKFYKFPNSKEILEICKRPSFDQESLKDGVLEIINRVRTLGDKALFEYTKLFDGIALKSLSVNVDDFLPQNSDDAFTSALKIAIENVTIFHKAQRREGYTIQTSDGVSCERKIVPLSSIGIYVPGGSAPLFSSLIMQIVPALIAEVKDIVVCVPPSKTSLVPKEIAQTANLLGIKKLYPIGGAQAIAAMALGTESIPKVDKIFGPGNQYVTAAKEIIQELGTPIDLPAGPSEVAVICDETSNPQFVAWDLLSQAEHGSDSQVLLVSWDESFILEVQKILAEALLKMPRGDLASKSLKASSAVLVRNKQEAISLINSYAPEHLIISCSDEDSILSKIQNAGSIFIGKFTPESLGDYASGTNHVLPTGGLARTLSGLSVESFQKSITVQKASKEGLKLLGPVVMKLAQGEGLYAHAEAVRVRLRNIEEEI